MRVHRLVSPAILALFLLGCDNAIPKGKEAYVGHWQGPGLDLDIAASGKVTYKREQGDNRNPVTAELNAFHGDDMEVANGPITTTFKVSAPPHDAGGTWKMTVDGIELTRKP